ncbi:hypothetical protein BUALT_Bualt15G0027600 [Buddleja alternifolia]|uniref:Glycosyltransferase n=1 Tax=Buddleja alternifolia TaxID=168488 RepID=A0AAV6WDI2_9LAMI|nr:hypothetical protein BUALT_Bualt15G0027600 [Buddleja alternifolia]
MIGDRRDSGLTRKDCGSGVPTLPRSRITTTIAIGVFLGCVLGFFYPVDVFVSWPPFHDPITFSNSEVIFSSCKSSERINMLKSEYITASERNTELKKQIRELTKKLQLAEQRNDNAEKQVLVLGEQQKASHFSTVKVIPDDSINPKLAKILEKVTLKRELIVILASSSVKDMFEVWFTSIKRVGITNYLVYALDDEIAGFCKSNDVHVYKRDPDELDETFKSIARIEGNHEVSGLKFRILREFLQMGYSVLLSDVDVVYIQNPFDHLYRDSDVECMTDGHDNMTAYGYNDVFDEPKMGWARYAHTMRIWVYNSGFFYIRPTMPSIELFDRVTRRLSSMNAWDEAVFNEELFYPSHPGYVGLHASRRIMDYYMFMNSKVLFKTVRKDAKLRKLKPVIVHMTYHPDKLQRMKAVVDYYVNGKQDALNAFPDGSDW